MVRAAAIVFVGIALAVGVSYELARRKANELPAYFPMPAFSLVDQDGRPFSSDELAGEVVIVSFVFSRCPTICPLIMSRMATLQSKLDGAKEVHLLSISVDPGYDTPERLRAFGARFGQRPERWTLLTGEIVAVRSAVEKGFKIGIQERAPGDVLHGEHLLVVDRAGAVRGVFASSETEKILEVVERLREEDLP